MVASLVAVVVQLLPVVMDQLVEEEKQVLLQELMSQEQVVVDMVEIIIPEAMVAAAALVIRDKQGRQILEVVVEEIHGKGANQQVQAVRVLW